MKSCAVVLATAGDHDYVVPYTGTRAWVYGMDLQEAKPWHSWSLPGDDQVGFFYHSVISTH